MFLGLVLLAVGVIALLVKLGVLTGSIWSYTWPVIIIILGLLLIFRPRFGHRSRWYHWCCPPGEDREDKKP